VRGVKKSRLFFYPFAGANWPVYAKVTGRMVNRQVEKPHQQRYFQSCISYDRYCSSKHHHGIVKKLLREGDTGGSIS